jgi:lipopolysaccharide/colanic/teichoic acid biosynthesis glycosyltransferase/protein involved in polysaccharide export with SLBB domain
MLREELAHRLLRGGRELNRGDAILKPQTFPAADITLATVVPAPEGDGWRIWRLTQQFGALMLLLAAAPLLILLAVVVKCDSPGPFLYSQRRRGYRGKPFTAWKVRTMTVGADRDPMLALAVTSSTPEVTRVGRYLRDLKIDELPQLWNVVRGEMAFVGPRPIAPGLQDYLENNIPGFATRLSVPPGLTSLGQVCIDENESVERVVHDWSMRFEAERHYVALRSVSYDLIIIGMTLAYCLRKVLRILPRGAVIRLAALGPLALMLVLSLAGCADTLRIEEFHDSGTALSRPIPPTQDISGAPVTEYEAVSVDSLPRGEAEPLYLLGAGDRLAINVFGEPGMENLIVQLDGAGEIQVPMLERVKAAGLSLSELQNKLKQGYDEHFLNPWVVVQLQEPLSRPLYLLGEFNQPGIVHMTGATNIIQALGAGKGLSSNAYTRGARLIRENHIVAVDIHELLNGGRMDQNVWLQPNDTVFVPNQADLRIFVLGAVVQPGAQPFSNAALTLGEAIARSGGPRRGEAQMEQVRVIRANSPVSGELFVVDFTRVLNGESMDMPLQPGDIVYMPVNGMGGWNDIIKAISPTIVTLGRALDPFVLAKALENN